MTMPLLKPERPYFASGPCTKRPGWDPIRFRTAFVGRSHRVPEGQARLQQVIEKSRDVLQLPDDYLVAIVPASDTGAVEMLLWNLLGWTGVEVCEWESFGRSWLHDIAEELRITDLTVHSASGFGGFPDLSSINFNNDVIFTWNGTTSGVCVPDANWIPEERKGLTICDATSAMFCMNLDYRKLDAVTWSWQKALGGEGAHGMIALSPAAVERLKIYRPNRAIPKIFRLFKDGALFDNVFQGFTINTPSMLAVEDALDALTWAQEIGGLPALVDRTQKNFSVVKAWTESSAYVKFLSRDPATISPASVCLEFTHPFYDELTLDQKRHFTSLLCDKIAEHQAGYDINSYRDAPPGLRIWAGATVETQDLVRLLPWIDWAFAAICEEMSLQ